QVKDPGELKRIRAAAVLADEAFNAMLERGLTGRTERAVALDLEDEMRHRGAAAPSFPSIIAAGPHGALPHAEPRDVAIEAGDLVVIDFGALIDGYCSDCPRTVATGELDDESPEVYRLVRGAQQAGAGAARAGPRGGHADAPAASG